jgi:hypothetical protein
MKGGALCALKLKYKNRFFTTTKVALNFIFSAFFERYLSTHFWTIALRGKK